MVALTTPQSNYIAVDFQHNAWDRKVIAMRRAGFTAEAIARSTGLRVGQVQYRVVQSGFSVRAYRRGETADAREMIDKIDDMVQRVKDIREGLLRTARRYTASPPGKEASNGHAEAHRPAVRRATRKGRRVHGHAGHGRRHVGAAL